MVLSTTRASPASRVTDVSRAPRSIASAVASLLGIRSILIGVCLSCIFSSHSVISLTNSECALLEDIRPNLGYCAFAVKWNVTLSANASTAALEENAHDLYRAQLEIEKERGGGELQDVQDAALNSCLSYTAYYGCVTQFRRCVDGKATPLCRHVCLEHARRCDRESAECEGLADEDCSAAARDGLGAVLAVAAGSLTTMVITGWSHAQQCRKTP